MLIPLQDALMICANLVPIGIYFTVLGVLLAVGRPLVTTGSRDYAALALALAGLAINGPINYLLHCRIFPEVMGASAWVGLILYLVIVAALWPRSQESLIVYNGESAVVAASVCEILQRHGIPYTEAPGGWLIPQRGVSIAMDDFPPLSNVTLHFRGLRDRELFEHLQADLASLLEPARARRSVIGLVMASVGTVIVAMPVWMVANHPQNIAALVREVLRSW